MRKAYEGEPTSPQPSVDRLSVTFADDSLKSDSSTKINYFNPVTVKMDVVNPTNTDGDDSDQEDYSASANVIIQRRASIRKSKKRSRRASSPFSPDILPPGTENGRRSSVFTTSSGELVFCNNYYYYFVLFMILCRLVLFRLLFVQSIENLPVLTNLYMQFEIFILMQIGLSNFES
ncbi:unnamed protein product [Psylliodes chrysocephalus]|uniref:Uncharacterized protein n=1 Tax=Psylliodes chrysocephalus TaxID=3402493 RepID=A0A9P0G410_9CUCU|nr:unnamed protein product [Psylliodes chrysocephala]